MTEPALAEITETLRDALPASDPARQRALVGFAALVARLVTSDLCFSADESRRLRSALDRVEVLSFDERDALAGLAEHHALALRGLWVHECAVAVRLGLAAPGPSQAYDVLIDVAMGSGTLGWVYTLATILGHGVDPLHRAIELGIEPPLERTYTRVDANEITLDRDLITIGTSLHAISVGWAQLVLVAGVDPWPGLHVRWRERGYPGDAWYRPWRNPEAFAERVRKLVAHVEARLGELATRRVDRGWIGKPDIQWEVVAGFPDEPTAGGRGAYRTAGKRTPDEPIVARRAAPASFERMLLWLASRADTPWREHVEDIVVTDTYLYARRRDSTIARLPLWALRTRLGTRDGVYVFGQRTRVVLPQRSGPCPVAQHLDALLRAR